MPTGLWLFLYDDGEAEPPPYAPGRSNGMNRTVRAFVIVSLNAREIVNNTISPGSGPSGNFREFDLWNSNIQLDETSEPRVDGDVIDLSYTIPSGGYVDIDLTQAAAARDKTLEESDLSGRRLIAWYVLADRDNNNPIVIAPGASNGYRLFGMNDTTPNAVSFFPGQVVGGGFTEGSEADTPIVSETTRMVRISGTHNDSVIIGMVFGTPPAA
jgi:hypothetical protein